jgi:hypothetical protein
MLVTEDLTNTAWTQINSDYGGRHFNSQTQVFQLILMWENVLFYVVLFNAVSFYLVTFRNVIPTLYDNTLC